ncbi:MAG: chemotaxis protein CheW [Gammaproteobacteria bacterium]|nr:chemotaxis protein CheW [Gammaproteobacteria bacterium]
MTQLTSDVNNRIVDKAQVKKYLTFLLDEKTYAVSILKVKEILEYDTVTPIPKMPDFVFGAINLRGKVVPVVDLRQCLEQKKCEIGKRSCIVIIEVAHNAASANIGIVVDAVSKVMDFNFSDIEKAPALGESIDTDFIEAMGKIDDQFVIMLNIDKIMTMEEVSKLAVS